MKMGSIGEAHAIRRSLDPFAIDTACRVNEVERAGTVKTTSMMVGTKMRENDELTICGY